MKKKIHLYQKKKLGVSLKGLSLKIQLNYHKFYFYFYSNLLLKIK